MKIKVEHQKKVGDLQKEFHKLFPYLRMEFIVRPSGRNDLSPSVFKQKAIGEVQAIRQDGAFDITPETTVTELELKFKEHYGIIISIQRLSGKAWLEPTFTKGWTLNEQNEQGKNLAQS